MKPFTSGVILLLHKTSPFFLPYPGKEICAILSFDIGASARIKPKNPVRDVRTQGANSASIRVDGDKEYYSDSNIMTEFVIVLTSTALRNFAKAFSNHIKLMKV